MYNTRLYSGGTISSSATVMNCYLYPNESGDTEAVGLESVSAKAARDLFEQLVNTDFVDGYQVYKKELYDGYPGLSGSPSSEFTDWALNNNPDIADEAGCHMLVGEAIEYAGGAHGSDYRDDPNYPDDFDYDANPNHSAFEYGVTMFTGLSNKDGTSHSDSRVRNFIMQENLHVFSSPDYWYPGSGLLNCDDSDVSAYMPDEHMLGVVWDYGPYGSNPITPFLTSHVTEEDDGYAISNSDLQECGPCNEAADWQGAYYDQITDCTNDAIKETVNGIN